MNKQIEEMAKHIKNTSLPLSVVESELLADVLYMLGYRKQSEGEWIYYDCVSSFDGMVSGYACSCCDTFIYEDVFSVDYFPNKYCPNCGARMRKEDEGK